MVDALAGDVIDGVDEAVRNLGAAVFEAVRRARPTAAGYLGSPVDVSASFPDHGRAVVTAFAADSDLAPLVAGGEIEHADGSGGSWSGAALPNALVKWARDRLLIEAEPVGDGAMISRRPIAAEGWISALDRCIDDLRLIIAGREIEVPVAVSLGGLPLPQDYREQLPGIGRLRRPTDYELAHSELVEDPTAILCRVSKSTMTLVAPADRRRLQIRYPDADDLDLDAGTKILVACTLAAGPSGASALRPVLQAVDRCNALYGVQRVGARRDPRIKRAWAHVSFEDIPSWTARVVAAWAPDVSISGRYLIRALREPDPQDALIAAAIAWDSLAAVGSRERATPPSASQQRASAASKALSIRRKVIAGTVEPEDDVGAASQELTGAIIVALRERCHRFEQRK